VSVLSFSPSTTSNLEQCPLAKKCELRVVNREARLVQCFLRESEPCPRAISFGDGKYCHTLFGEVRAE
jgi:hypothetical protein